jgi:hypothetical protein
VEGLSDLGGGRIWANRDEFVRTGTHQMMSHMDPRTMQHPEMFGNAAQGFRSRGQELPPGHRLIVNNSPTSPHGALIDQNTVVMTVANTTNKVQERTFATQNGKIIRQGPANRHAAGPVQPIVQAIAPRKSTMRIQSSTSSHGAPPAKKAPATGTLLDRKRQNAVFEAEIKYVKGGGTDLNKFVWAIVLLSPTNSPYMGYFILFLKKKEVYSLENQVVLNIVRGAADKDNHVLLRIKENEVRESSHRLIFETAVNAKDFLATVSRLMNGGVDVVPSETPIVAAAVTNMTDKPTTPATPSIAGQVALLHPQNDAAKPIPAVVPSTQPKVDDAKVPMVSVPAKTSHIESLKSKAASVSATNGEAGTSANPIIIPSANDTVGQEVPNGRYEEPETVEVNAPLPDLLSGPDVTSSDSAIETRIDAAQPTDYVADSPLFDLGADELSPSRSQTAYTSNMDQLEGLNEWYEAKLAAVPSDDDDHDAAKDDSASSDKSAAHVGDDTERMLECLKAMVKTLLLGFDTQGAAGNTKAELNRTISTIKRTVADSIREYAPDASYFPNLTMQQKLQVVEKFLAEGEGTQEETAIQSADETLVPEPGNSPPSSAATAVNSSPSRVTRIEYTPQELLDARSNAVSPPAWLKKLDFLPPVSGRQSVKEGSVRKEPVKQEPVKQESFRQATPSRSPTPMKPGTHGILLERSVSMTPFGRNLATRPAAPPTPVASPSPTIDKLEHKFEKLSLKDESGKLPSVSSLKVEEAPSPVQQPSSGPKAINSASKPIVKVEKPSPSVDHPAAFTDQAPMTQRKVDVNGSASATHPKVETFVSKDLETIKREVKVKVHGAFNFAQQVKPTAASPPAINTENIRPQYLTAVAKSNGHSNGQLTSPARLNPEAASFQQSVANYQTGPTQQNAPAGGGTRGLNNSRWATPATTKVEQEGRFTGLGFEKSR